MKGCRTATPTVSSSSATQNEPFAEHVVQFAPETWWVADNVSLASRLRQPLGDRPFGDDAHGEFGGRTETYRDEGNHYRVRWLPDRVVKGVAYDAPCPATRLLRRG